MQVPIFKSMFPAYAAAATLIKDHGTGAYGHVRSAIDSKELGARLDHSVRAFVDLDHAIDNVSKLPVDKMVPNVGKYLQGYHAAKAAVEALVATGVIPGARERVGLQQMLAAQDSFTRGIQVAKADGSKFGAKYASGWLDATLEDAAWASAMLRPGYQPFMDLVMGLKSIRSSADARRPLDDAQVQRVGSLFDQLTKELQDKVTLAQQAAPKPITGGPGFDEILARTDDLLAKAAVTAKDLELDAPVVVDALAPTSAA